MDFDGGWEFFTQAIDRWEGALNSLDRDTDGLGTDIQGRLWRSAVSTLPPSSTTMEAKPRSGRRFTGAHSGLRWHPT